MVQLCLGSANFGSKYGLTKKRINKKKITKIINTAKKMNVSNIDTSFEYVNSHQTLKKIINKKININTKIFLKKNYNFHSVKRKILDFNKSSSSKIYSLLLHNQNEALLMRKIKLLKKLKEEKVVSKVGVSVYDLSVLKKIFKLWTSDIVQLPVNPFNTKFISKNFLKLLKKKNITIFARSIFLKGILIKGYEYPNNKFKIDLDDWFKFCATKSVNPAKVCLDFARSIKEIDFLVIGVQDAEELKQIIKFFNQPCKIRSNLILKKKYNKIDLRKI